MNGSGVCWRLPWKRHCKCPFVRPWVGYPAPIFVFIFVPHDQKKKMCRK